MTKPREKTREELQAEIEDGKKKIRQFENREKCCVRSYPKRNAEHAATALSSGAQARNGYRSGYSLYGRRVRSAPIGIRFD